MFQCACCNKPVSSKISSEKDFQLLESGSWQLIESFMRKHPHTLSGYTLSSLVSWNNSFDYKWLLRDDTLLVSCILNPDPNRHFIQPVGPLTKGTQKAIIDYAKSLDYPMKIVGVDSSFINSHTDFISNFMVNKDRNFFNYIYSAADLTLLTGRRYSKKRNLISQAASSYSWTVEKLSQDNSEACLEIIYEIKKEQRTTTDREFALDDQAIETAVNLFSRLYMSGILIRIEGRPAAFSIYEQQTSDTAVVHFERALRKYKGLYQVLNQALAKEILEKGFTYINREEDLGDPGLRQAKESYFPIRLEESIYLTFTKHIST